MIIKAPSEAIPYEASANQEEFEVLQYTNPVLKELRSLWNSWLPKVDSSVNSTSFNEDRDLKLTLHEGDECTINLQENAGISAMLAYFSNRDRTMEIYDNTQDNNKERFLGNNLPTFLKPQEVFAIHSKELTVWKLM